jgi:hypothetical protein
MFIPDPTFFHPESEFFHPGSRIRTKEFKYFNPKKCFLSSRKSSGFFIPDPDPYFLPIPEPGVKKAPDRSRIRIRNTAFLHLSRFTLQPGKCGGAAGICSLFYDSAPSGTYGTISYLVRAACRSVIELKLLQNALHENFYMTI